MSWRTAWRNGVGGYVSRLTPEDTFDGDYGRLLERAQNSGKRLASPRGLDPFTVVGSATSSRAVAHDQT